MKGERKMGVRWRLLYMWGGSAGEMVFMPEATHEPTGIHFFVTQERPAVMPVSIARTLS